MPNFKNNKHLILIVYSTVLISVAILSLFITFLNHGFDFSDEGFYLNSILDPWIYDITSSQFGFIYHFLFNILYNNISNFRLITFIILFLCTFIYLYFLIKKYFFYNINNPIFLISLAFIFSVFSVLIYSLWLPTPNYNLLNYTGLLITTIGILLVDYYRNSLKKHLRRSLFGWLAIGLGGFLVFMAKPQSAVGLAVMVVLWAWHSKLFSLKGAALAVASSFGLLLASGVILDGSIDEFINRYQMALMMTKVAKSHDVAELLVLSPSFLKAAYGPKTLIFLAALLVWGAALARFSALPQKRRWLIFVALTSIAFAVWLFLLPETLSFIYSKGILICFPALGLILRDRVKGIYSDRGKLGFALLLISLSFLYSLGSNNPAVIGLSLSSLFIFTGLAIIAVKPGDDAIYRLAGLALMGLVIISFIMSVAWRNPYRQLSPLWAANVSVPIPQNAGKLRLPSYQAQFLDSVYSIANRASFQPGTPVIDLTGRLPGVIYAMGGRSPKTAWLGSGYSGSRDAAVMSLGRLTCVELASAWVIAASNPSPSFFDPGILAEAGLDHLNHYQLVGTANLLVEAYSRDFSHLELMFLKPMADWPERAQSCVATREAAQAIRR
jgi:hypothetical protein